MQTLSPQDYFCRRGHIRLALDLLRDTMQVLIKDPSMESQEAREELAWLRGESTSCPIDVGTVFDSLRLSGWAQRFAEMAQQDPRAMAERLRELNLQLERYFDGDDYTYRSDLKLEPISSASPAPAGPAQLSLLDGADDQASLAHGFDEFEPAMETYAEMARVC
jgi:hypothetical protein